MWQCLYLQRPGPLPVFTYFAVLRTFLGVNLWAVMCSPQPITVRRVWGARLCKNVVTNCVSMCIPCAEAWRALPQKCNYTSWSTQTATIVIGPLGGKLTPFAPPGRWEKKKWETSVGLEELLRLFMYKLYPPAVHSLAPDNFTAKLPSPQLTPQSPSLSLDHTPTTHELRYFCNMLYIY